MTVALSDYDTLAVDSNGPCDGTFVSPLGVVVEFYKNWIYVYDKSAWREGSYSEPCVMEVKSGDFTYLDVSIKAVRGPQDGIYAIVHTGRWRVDEFMVGCAVRGYDTRRVYLPSRDWRVSHERKYPWRGVKLSSMNHLRWMIYREWRGGWRYRSPSVPTSHPIWQERFWSQAQRFNQGDMFFAQNLQFSDDLVKSAPGASDLPIISRIIEEALGGGNADDQ